jgi:predicted RNA methylase
MKSMISDIARRVLSECTVQGNSVQINSGQLDRKLYENVNVVLDAMGGKWDRKAKGHVFSYDPSDVLASVVSTGEVPDKNPLAYFPSPQAVVDSMIDRVRLYGFNKVCTILEPSAGDGAIVAALHQRIPKSIGIVAIEIDPGRAQQIRDRNLPNVQVVEADFLQWQPEGRGEFEAILMNPPFRTPDRALAYLDHIERALRMRSKEGILLSVTPIGWQSGGNRKRLVQFREMVETKGYTLDLPEKVFSGSGTDVRTCVVEFVD